MKNRHEFEESVRKTLALYTEVGPRAGYAMQEIMSAASDYAEYRVECERAPSLFPQRDTAPAFSTQSPPTQQQLKDMLKGIRAELRGALPQGGR